MAGGGIVVQALRFALGLDFDGKGFGKAEDAIKNLEQMALRLGKGLAGGYLAKQFLDMAYATADTADKLDEYTVALNLNAEAYQKLSFAAKLQGVEQETLNGAFGTMYRVAAKAALGATGAAQKFGSIGVKVKDSNGQLKSTTDLFTEVGGAIRGLKNPSDQTAAAIRIFGEEGARLVPLFKQSDEQLAKYGAELEDLGGLMDQGFINRSADFGDMLDRQRKAMLGVRIVLTRAVLPALEAFAKAMAWLAKNFSGALRHTRAVESALITLGGWFTFVGLKAAWAGREVIWAWIKAAAPILAIVAAAALVALAFDDLWTFMEGGDSIIGMLIDGIGPKLDKLTELLDTAAEKWGHRIANSLSDGIGSADVIYAIIRVAKLINDYIILPLRALSGSKSALAKMSEHFMGNKQVQPAAYMNPDGSISYTSDESQQQYGAGPWSDDQVSAEQGQGPWQPKKKEAPIQRPADVPYYNTQRQAAQYNVSNNTRIEINPTIQGTGLSADQIAQSLGPYVDEKMQAHFDDAYGAHVPFADTGDQ